MSWRPPVLATLLVSLLVGGALAGCGDDGDAAPAPADTTTTEADTTTTAVDPFTVPDDPADVTVEYVEAVLTELERINGDALRLAMSEGMSPEVAELISAISTTEVAERRVNLLLDESRAGWDGLIDPPGDVTTEVVAILVASPECVSADVTQDFSDVGVSGAVVDVRIELVRAEPRSNDTGWLLSVRQPLLEQTELDEPCSSS